jgi:hypothetical protein
LLPRRGEAASFGGDRGAGFDDRFQSRAWRGDGGFERHACGPRAE